MTLYSLEYGFQYIKLHFFQCKKPYFTFNFKFISWESFIFLERSKWYLFAFLSIILEEINEVLIG